MTRWPPQVRANAVELAQRGFRVPSIRRNLHGLHSVSVPRSTVAGWLRRVDQ